MRKATREKRRERRRAERQAHAERLERLARRAATMSPVAGPTVWRAGWTGWILALLSCAHIVGYGLLGSPAEPGFLGGLKWLVFQAGAPLIWAYFACALANWSAVVDQHGVHVRVGWAIRSVLWERIKRVHAGSLGQLSIVSSGKHTDEYVSTPPSALPWVHRLAWLPDRAAERADLVTLLLHHPRLRPPEDTVRVRMAHPWMTWLAGACWAFSVFAAWT
ncbi:hypothetical protein AMK26_27945 [Streptomyces sp. CB03234]|uniref:hypothetical protein n=1 Tax=Streptomyces sp. (strain CB03234) TaxID=1703937 RepID=UPI00093F658D|nr:hypothetical protein [Streptomyces sp. CB03234]OKJ99815.1 hypothetical protein AMK26_27945 [Streptomyces sp. CB03234]